jgi:hypothetical protein
MLVLGSTWRWRYFPLLVTALTFAGLIPYGNVTRRLLPILPCIAIAIAATATEVLRWFGRCEHSGQLEEPAARISG